MYCGLVVNDAQPHQLFEEYVERPADPSLDLSGMLPALRDTVASIEALGDNPFPELKKLLVKDPHPLATALNELLLDMPVSVQCDPMPGALFLSLGTRGLLFFGRQHAVLQLTFMAFCKVVHPSLVSMALFCKYCDQY